MTTFALITVEIQKVVGSSPLIPFDEWVELIGERKENLNQHKAITLVWGKSSVW